MKVSGPKCSVGKCWNSRASSGPSAMPMADDPTKAALALVRSRLETKSAM